MNMAMACAMTMRDLGEGAACRWAVAEITAFRRGFQMDGVAGGSHMLVHALLRQLWMQRPDVRVQVACIAQNLSLSVLGALGNLLTVMATLTAAGIKGGRGGVARVSSLVPWSWLSKGFCSWLV